MTNLNPKTSDIAHEQRKKIFALSRDAHLSGDELHHYMNEWAGVTSLSAGNCSFAEANKIIDSLKSIAKKRKSFTSSSGAGAKGGATEKQVNAIKTIQRILGWNDGRLNGFIDHTVEKRIIEDLTVPEASKVIIGLRRMVK